MGEVTKVAVMLAIVKLRASRDCDMEVLRSITFRWISEPNHEIIQGTTQGFAGVLSRRDQYGNITRRRT